MNLRNGVETEMGTKTIGNDSDDGEKISSLYVKTDQQKPRNFLFS